MEVRFLDLRVNDPDERKEIMTAVERILDHGRILLGPEVEEFEHELAQYCGTNHAIGVGSGSIALFCALKALDIGHGDEVITTSLSFVGTANGIALAGATPVFIDIRDDLTMDPQRIEAAISPRTKAIMPVHFTGKLCQMEEIQTIADRHGLYVIEDAAPAIGAERDGKRAGKFGIMGCLSLNPMKVLGACGEAGAVVTDDPILREKLEAIRYNGLIGRERCEFASTNARIDTIQSAILISRLKRLEGIIARRRKIAARYNTALKGLVQVPEEAPGCRDVYYTYTIQADDRDGLTNYLSERGIESKLQHPSLMPHHPQYQGTDLKQLPVGSRAVNRVLCLPANEKLADQEVDYVIEHVQAFYKN